MTKVENKLTVLNKQVKTSDDWLVLITDLVEGSLWSIFRYVTFDGFEKINLLPKETIQKLLIGSVNQEVIQCDHKILSEEVISGLISDNYDNIDSGSEGEILLWAHAQSGLWYLITVSYICDTESWDKQGIYGRKIQKLTIDEIKLSEIVNLFENPEIIYMDIYNIIEYYWTEQKKAMRTFEIILKNLEIQNFLLGFEKDV